MSTKIHLLAHVIQDRKRGTSLSDLSKKYKLAKSTVSLWCRGVVLSGKSRLIIREKWFKNTSEARANGTLKNKQKRIDSIERELEEAKKIMGNICERDLLIAGVALYWAEGSKKEVGSGFSFINSDHSMVKVMCKWLTNTMHIKKNQLIINVCINVSHESRENEILKFWSNLIDFPVSHFGKTIFIRTPHRKIYSNSLHYFGMLRIRVKSSSWLRRRILGMIRVFIEKMPT